MKEEDLKKLKQKLQTLKEYDKKHRIKYLYELSNGTLYGPTTGYPSIDMPWLKHFSKKTVETISNFDMKDESMYQTLYNYAINHLDDIAFGYLGNDFTYKQLLDNIDKVSTALIKNEVKEKDIVTIVLPNIPEARYLIYACSKIGAIANPIMPTVSDIDLNEIINNTKCKKLFLMQGLKSKFSTLLKEKNIETIEVNPIRSSGGVLSLLYLIKNAITSDEFNRFTNSGNDLIKDAVKAKANDVALIEQTGGTTGLTTKGVVITNGNVYASNYQLENGEFNFESGDKLLDILLPSISYGAAFEHLTLCNGIKNEMIPVLVTKKISKYISKYKPNHIMMGPIHFEYICKDKKKRKWNYIKNIVSGGDSMSSSLEETSNEKLIINRSKVSLEQGYGMSECFGAAACNHNNFIKKGSVGVPHILTTISIFEYNESKEDYTTDNEVQTNCVGEICIKSPVVMKEYLNNKENTKYTIKNHSDGTTWLHTGDVGYVDKDGYLFVTDRIKDLIFRRGFKVSPQKICKVISENIGNVLEDCIVIGIPDEIERNVPMLFYKLKENSEINNNVFISKLEEIYNTKLSEIEIPKQNIELDEIPRTSVGKINKKLIKKKYLESKSKGHL